VTWISALRHYLVFFAVANAWKAAQLLYRIWVDGTPLERGVAVTIAPREMCGGRKLGVYRADRD
jgi:hypothetical protein